MESATIKAEKMVSGGDCIAKIDGKTVFVPYSVPGETLSIQIEKEMRDYSTARIVEVLEPSPHRTKPFCPLYTKCGGCNAAHYPNPGWPVRRMQHAAYRILVPDTIAFFHIKGCL